MQEINLEASANEANEHFYYKKLRKELHDKKSHFDCTYVPQNARY